MIIRAGSGASALRQLGEALAACAVAVVLAAVLAAARAAALGAGLAAARALAIEVVVLAANLDDLGEQPAAVEPLGCLTVARSGTKKRTKTQLTREVPIHPTLAAIIEESADFAETKRGINGHGAFSCAMEGTSGARAAVDACHGLAAAGRAVAPSLVVPPDRHRITTA